MSVAPKEKNVAKLFNAESVQPTEQELNDQDRVAEIDSLPTEKKPQKIALQLILLFAAASACVVVFLSERFLEFLGIGSHFAIALQPYKPLFVFALTAPILYWLITRQAKFIESRYLLVEEEGKKIGRLNRIHQIKSKINHVVLRIQNREQLLREACDIALHGGKYTFVWAGLCQGEGFLPETVVDAGQGGNYLSDLFTALKDNPAGERSEPALTALRKKYDIVVNDVSAYSKSNLPWQTRALENGFNAIAAFTIVTTTGMRGVFAIYAEKAHVFSTEEIELLREIIADLNFGLSDIEFKEELYHSANFDVVTNLPIRQLFEDRLNSALARNARDKSFTGVAVFEIRELDDIVKARGQTAGDKVLQEVGKHLTKFVGAEDSLGRIGQNAIAFMMANKAYLNDIIAAVESALVPINVMFENNKPTDVNLRAGLAVYPHDGKSAKALIKNASDALENRKTEASHDFYFYSKELATGIRYYQRIKQELLGAMERQEFYVCYQPIVNVAQREIAGMEAFVRWAHPTLGEVSPVQFIPLAEETELMTKLGNWVLRTACTQILEWKAKGKNLYLLVNISEKQLHSPHFIDEIVRIFNDLKLNPKEQPIGFDIKESALGTNFDATVKVLNAVRKKGIKIFIDDFGVGQFSLKQIHELPIDALKIDAVFVRGLGKDSNAKILVQGVIALAKGLNLATVAEGVETEAQVEILRELGCDTIQGYFFSPPVTAKNVEALFEKPV